MFACSHYHTVIQNEKNEIYVCGNNYSGQLELGDDKYRNSFEKLEYYFGEIKKIACGYHHTVIQNEKNEVYVCGFNGYGQLGLGDNKRRNKFEKVEHDFGKIKNIACGGFYTIIQNEKNEIYACGYNMLGQLGLGDNKSINLFKKIDYDFGEVKNITCGLHHTIIQNEKNEVYVCGYNEFGQLGSNDYYSKYKFEKVEYDFGEIKNIACGGCHTVIQNDKNEIYVCGENKYGQLGLGDNYNRNKFEKVVKKVEIKVEIKKIVNGGLLYKILQTIYSLFFGKKYEKVEYSFGNIKNITCGEHHIVIQNEKNDIYVCGWNNFGQMGLGDIEYKNEFEKVEYDFGKIKNIACGGYHTVIQNEKNDVYVCGYNKYGQLGSGDYKNRDKFEKVDTDDIFEKIYNFEFQLNTKEIVL